MSRIAGSGAMGIGEPRPANKCWAEPATWISIVLGGCLSDSTVVGGATQSIRDLVAARERMLAREAVGRRFHIQSQGRSHPGRALLL